MSLIVEQRLNGVQFSEFEPKIYSTGVYLVPMEISINGAKQFVWVAHDFNNDTHYDGKLISPQIQANSIIQLLNNSDE